MNEYTNRYTYEITSNRGGVYIRLGTLDADTGRVSMYHDADLRFSRDYGSNEFTASLSMSSPGFTTPELAKVRSEIYGRAADIAMWLQERIPSGTSEHTDDMTGDDLAVHIAMLLDASEDMFMADDLATL